MRTMMEEVRETERVEYRNKHYTSTDELKERNRKYQYYRDLFFQYVGEWKRTHREQELNLTYNAFECIHQMHVDKLITEKQYTSMAKQFAGYQRMVDYFNANIEKFNKSNNKIKSNCSAAPTRAVEQRSKNNAAGAKETITDKETINENKTTQQDAIKQANLAFVEKICSEENKQFNTSVLDEVVRRLVKLDISMESKNDYINQYFDTVKTTNIDYCEAMRKITLNKLNVK